MPAEATGSPSNVLVTGASSGIGEALARCFARHGHRLVLVARRESRLRALAELLCNEHGTHVDGVTTDLARRGAAATLAAMLRRRRRAIDVLVNNAGVLGLGAFVGSSAAQHHRLIDLNVAGLTAMLAAFVPAMVRRGHGRGGGLPCVHGGRNHHRARRTQPGSERGRARHAEVAAAAHRRSRRAAEMYTA